MSIEQRRQSDRGPGGVATRVVVSVLVLLGLAAAAGLVWARWAQPGRWEVTEVGAVLSQRAAQAQFGVELRFIAVGAVLCLLWAAVAGAVCRALGWVLVPLFAVAAVAAALVAWKVGVALGPPDPSTVTDLDVGETFPDQLGVDSVAGFLVWPSAALGGLVMGLLTAGVPHTSERVDVDDDATEHHP